MTIATSKDIQPTGVFGTLQMLKVHLQCQKEKGKENLMEKEKGKSEREQENSRNKKKGRKKEKRTEKGGDLELYKARWI